jgi:hypothetical protein
LRDQLPTNKLFTINSVLSNLENDKIEIISKYKCFFNLELNSLSLLIEDDLKISSLSKEVILNFIEFAQRLQIKFLRILLNKTNPDYVKFLQELMTIGFANDGMGRIKERDYKALQMTVKLSSNKIEEMAF